MPLRQLALAALAEPDPDAKCAATAALWAQRDALPWDTEATLSAPPQPLPGRPDQPHLVNPQSLPRRSPATAEGRAALMHAICHIEFNAINLALDAIWRFAQMPPAYYRDWLQVAQEEAQHFQMVRAHLREQGHDYGDFEAHDGLWELAERTAHDVLARMALVPRTMEARGLDATPPIQSKLRQAGDVRAVAILDVILREEVGHVAIGNRWFNHLCTQRGLEPLQTYATLAQMHKAPKLKRPFNLSARAAAGFSPAELQALQDAGANPGASRRSEDLG